MRIHPADFSAFMRDIASDTEEYVQRELAAATAPLQAEIATLRAEIFELKQREHQGVWDPGQAYAKGAMVSRQGSTWLSTTSDNRGKPGESRAWTLIVKAGRDGKDARS